MNRECELDLHLVSLDSHRLLELLNDVQRLLLGRLIQLHDDVTILDSALDHANGEGTACIWIVAHLGDKRRDFVRYSTESALKIKKEKTIEVGALVLFQKSARFPFLR